MALLVLEDVTKTFSVDPLVEPLRHVDLTLESGDFIAITGLSGMGKSTLLNMAGSLMHPTSGRVLFQGRDMATLPPAELDEVRRSGISYIFQEPYLFQALTVEENLVFASRTLHASGRGGRACGATDCAKIDGMLKRFGLDDRRDHLPSELSVGQRRRLAAIRAFMAQPLLLLADEPTNDLDHDAADLLFDEFDDLRAHGAAIVVVTHDERYASRAGHEYLLEGGRLIGRGWTDGS